MTGKQEDIIFKDVSEEEVDVFLKRLNIKSKKKKLNPTEIRYIDVAILIADIIIELDDMILIIEFQSTNVDTNDKNRFLAYFSVVNFKKKTKKEVKLLVISTAERSKRVTHIIDDIISFKFDIFSMMDMNGDAIINNIENKMKKKEKITNEELIDLSLVPVMGSENTQVEQIEKSVNLILSINLEDYKVKNLVKSIAYLLADKFLEDGEHKTILCDALGGKMNAVYDYGERRKQEGIIEGMKEGKKEGMKEGRKEGSEKMALYMIKKGESDEEIQKETELSLDEIKALRKKQENN